jgi:hypothetical protein
MAHYKTILRRLANCCLALRLSPCIHPMSYASPLFLIQLWLFVFVLSMATALMEIQIEGGNGWAKLLPSWRIAPPWLKKILNGKDITGYHVYLNLHSLIFLHFPILLTGWSWQMELTILFVMCSFVVCEDVLWFILNPHFGWLSFKREKIPWYTSWWGPLPTDYYFWIILSVLFAVLRGTLPGAPVEPSLMPLPLPMQHLVGWIAGLATFLLCTASLTILVTPRIQRFLESDIGPHPGHPVHPGEH